MVYWRDLHVPDNSRVDIQSSKYKADKVILGKRKRLDEGVFIKALKEGKIELEIIENQTEDICLAAVNRWRLSLKYVIKQTEGICWHQSGRTAWH
jgi:hypothetical protein